MTLLDVGCGWGADDAAGHGEVRRQRHRPDAVEEPEAYCDHLLKKVDSDRSPDVLLEGWEQFHEPVDRIVSIEAFEHFGLERYDDFFKNCFESFPTTAG